MVNDVETGTASTAAASGGFTYSKNRPEEVIESLNLIEKGGFVSYSYSAELLGTHGNLLKAQDILKNEKFGRNIEIRANSDGDFKLCIPHLKDDEVKRYDRINNINTPLGIRESWCKTDSISGDTLTRDNAYDAYQSFKGIYSLIRSLGSSRTLKDEYKELGGEFRELMNGEPILINRTQTQELVDKTLREHPNSHQLKHMVREMWNSFPAIQQGQGH